MSPGPVPGSVVQSKSASTALIYIQDISQYLWRPLPYKKQSSQRILRYLRIQLRRCPHVSPEQEEREGEVAKYLR